MESKRYFSFIGVARGIGILLVVAGHAIVPPMREGSVLAAGIYDLIYSFHMPLFAMFSGYLFEISLQKYKQRGFRAFVVAKLEQLMVPYLTFSLISYAGIAAALRVPALARILSASGYGLTPLPSAVLQILTCENHVDKHIWFVYALFLVFLISFPLEKALRTPVGLLAQAALYIVTQLFPGPEIINRAIYLLFFFSLARRTDWIDRLTRKRAILPLALCFCALFALRYCQWPLGQPLPLALTGLVCAIAGALVTLGLCAFLSETGRAARLLTALGGYSYAIYLIHQPFIVSGTAGVLFFMTALPMPVICAVATAAGLGIPLLVTRFFVGRFRLTRRLVLGDFSKRYSHRTEKESY